MRFYNREAELAVLCEVEKQAKVSSKMTFIVGRRRIGKTKLILEAYQKNLVYFFVSRKSEHLLCIEFSEQLELALDIQIHGEFNQFSKLFAYVLELAKSYSFTLAIDEFQEFYNINPSIYSEIQNLWDRNKDITKLNLVLSGSIYSLMHKIFESAKEPLYGRANKKLHLKAFNIATIVEIFKDFNARVTPEHMLAFYTVSGGVAKYVELLSENNAFSLQSILDVLFLDGSVFINEGRDILIEEFGKEYAVYFSILSLIASSKTSRSEIESIIGKSVGGYLDRLETTFGLIQTVRPIFSKPGGRVQKYQIKDNFLNFWFRFIYKHQSAIEIENYNYIKDIIYKDFKVYSGEYLEYYFIEKLKNSKKYNMIGRYWERGNQNEIDIIAVNQLQKEALIVEVKHTSKRISIEKLKQKSKKLIENELKNYHVKYIGLSLENMFDGF